MSFTEAVRVVFESPLFAITLTVGFYWLADHLWRRLGRPALLNPVLVTITAVAVSIVLLKVDYATYFKGAKFIDLLLGPATVALAIPLYRQRKVVKESAVMVVAAIFTGGVMAVVAGYFITSETGGSEQLALSMAPKSVTTPIAIALSDLVGGIPSLSAIFAVVAGLVGAVCGPTVLKVFHITDPRVRGLAMGIASHGVGTARALQESEQAGAFSGLGMALSGLVTSICFTLLIQLILQS